jgi:hypothetical protein
MVTIIHSGLAGRRPTTTGRAGSISLDRLSRSADETDEKLQIPCPLAAAELAATMSPDARLPSPSGDPRAPTGVPLILSAASRLDRGTGPRPLDHEDQRP